MYPTRSELQECPARPDHQRFRQAKTQACKLDASVNRSPNERSDNLAAALTVRAKAEALRNIQGLVLSDDRNKAFVFDDDRAGNLLRRYAGVEIVPAMSQSIERSTKQISDVNAALAHRMRDQEMSLHQAPKELSAAQPDAKSM